MSVQGANAAPPPAGTIRPLLARAGRFALNENALTLLVLLLVACGLLSRNFASPQNLANLADQLPIFAILAAGQLIVILTGGIDLSVGSVLALCAFFAASMSYHGIVPALVVPLLVGGGVGMINGLGAAYTRVPPFIITLAMLSIARGFALQAAAWYNGGSVTGTGAAPVSASRDFGFPLVSSGSILGLPIAALIAIGVFVAIAYVLRYEPFGRHVYAVGGNEPAALLLGVSVKRVKVLVYTLSGVLAGLAGVLYASREGSAPPTAAGGYELDAITAVVVGGALLTGGVGTVRGTVIGLLIVRILPNIFNLLGLDPAWQQVARGGVLLAVVLIQIPMIAANNARTARKAHTVAPA
jgi:ribose/xylose/arabinose/galactoside ABC-type transport system permease subunit